MICAAKLTSSVVSQKSGKPKAEGEDGRSAVGGMCHGG
jgi:hypothetical protein